MYFIPNQHQSYREHSPATQPCWFIANQRGHTKQYQHPIKLHPSFNADATAGRLRQCRHEDSETRWTLMVSRQSRHFFQFLIGTSSHQIMRKVQVEKKKTNAQDKSCSHFDEKQYLFRTFLFFLLIQVPSSWVINENLVLITFKLGGGGLEQLTGNRIFSMLIRGIKATHSQKFSFL